MGYMGFLSWIFWLVRAMNWEFDPKSLKIGNPQFSCSPLSPPHFNHCFCPLTQTIKIGSDLNYFIIISETLLNVKIPLSGSSTEHLFHDNMCV